MESGRPRDRADHHAGVVDDLVVPRTRVRTRRRMRGRRFRLAREQHRAASPALEAEIAERKQREDVLRASNRQIQDLAGRLITAQEAERTRIARDLHDDSCQEVAGIAVDISNLVHRRDIRDVAVRQALSSVHSRVAGVAESLRLLSHDLHPSVLQHIGLVAALEAHCVEVERHYDVQVKFSAEGDVEPAVPTVALSLSVVDDGVGFDVAGARQNGGLGLVSIEERARIVKGQVTIRSQFHQGTRVDVRVPVSGALDAHPTFN
jgi:signal transduction histidine kinase